MVGGYILEAGVMLGCDSTTVLQSCCLEGMCLYSEYSKCVCVCVCVCEGGVRLHLASMTTTTWVLLSYPSWRARYPITSTASRFSL